MARKDIKRDLVIKVIILSLWLTTLLLPTHVDAFCPHLCHCDDLQMIVTCPPESKLDVIPITLNPNLRELHLKGKFNLETYITKLYERNKRFIQFFSYYTSNIFQKIEYVPLMHHFNFMVNYNMSTFPKMKCLIFLNVALQVRKRFENKFLS